MDTIEELAGTTEPGAGGRAWVPTHFGAAPALRRLYVTVFAGYARIVLLGFSQQT